MRGRLIGALAGVLLALGATVAGAPAASANPGGNQPLQPPAGAVSTQAASATWLAGAVFNNYDATGYDRMSINFTRSGPNNGFCDSTGYRVDLQGTSQWNYKVSAIDTVYENYWTPNDSNGCNAVTLTRNDGATWTCQYSCLANAPKPFTIQLGGGFDNNTRYIRFFRG